MVETITPAVCGTRTRQLGALASFAVGAVAAAAAVGALLGLAGSAVGRPAALALAVVLALAGAAREAGAVRFPLPQLKRQVPERWRFTLPLPIWATGYGVGLGAGVFTYQPAATFWVACAGALALGRPLAGAAAFALYGVGRTAVLLLPARRGADATSVVERLAGRRRTVLRANAVVLAVCACLLALSPVAHADVMPLGPGNQLDPAAAYRTFAFTERVGAKSSVVVRPKTGAAVEFPGAREPSLHGGRMAYADAQGIRVVRWATGEEVARIAGPVDKPALEWPWIAFRRELPSGRRRLTLRNLQTGEVRGIAYAAHEDDLGRPSIAGGRVAWHRYWTGGSRILMYRISTRKTTIVFHTRIALLSNPSISSRRLLWIDQDRFGRSRIFTRAFGSTHVRRLGVATGRSSYYWTTELYGGTAYVTRWNSAKGAARILRFGL